MSVAIQTADTPAAYRFGACNDGCCFTHVCMACSHKDAVVGMAKIWGTKPLTFEDLESDGKDVACDRCKAEIYRKGAA